MACLFSRAPAGLEPLPERVRVVRQWGPLSGVRVGQVYAWREVGGGCGCYEPDGAGDVVLMAFEVRRHLGTHYVSAAAEVAA